MSYLQPLSEMERIEHTLISEKLDELLDRIDKENIGFVITESGKDKYVLCPYWWFEKDFDDDLGRVINSAIRKELSASSENTEAVQRFIRNHHRALDDESLRDAVQELNAYIATATDPTKAWLEVRALLQDELNKRYSEKGAKESHG
ncbi:MAG: hypothetical protein ACI3W5_08565 [Faecousia sp.]